MFSASFYKINEEDQRNNEIEFFINLNINHNLQECDIDIIDVRTQLEHQCQIQETKESGWIFDKTKSMKRSIYKTGELNGEFLDAPDDKDIGYFIEVELKYSDYSKKKQKNSPFVLKIKLFLKINIKII